MSPGDRLIAFDAQEVRLVFALYNAETAGLEADPEHEALRPRNDLAAPEHEKALLGLARIRPGRAWTPVPGAEDAPGQDRWRARRPAVRWRSRPGASPSSSSATAPGEAFFTALPGLRPDFMRGACPEFSSATRADTLRAASVSQDRP